MNFCRFRTGVLTCLFSVTVILAIPISAAGAEKLIAGTDISMLPEIEKAGGVFKQNSKPGDAIQILKDNGCNLFRVRLFVQPSTNFNKSWGATQDLPYVRALAKRIKASGQAFLLDIHYSDTWADGAHQTMPKSWNDADFKSLEKHVFDYTAAVMKDLQDNGAAPDMVQIGNEIAGGILWPFGKVLAAAPDVEKRQWEQFTRLCNAGAKAVRASQRDGQTIRIMIHIHGGGHGNLPVWFFKQFSQHPVDYDIMGLSFYPAWADSMDAIKKNMSELVIQHHKDILIAETSYPWKEMQGIKNRDAMKWPMTIEGQNQFVRDLSKCLKDVSEGRGIGFVWWYPEAIPMPDLFIWRGGAEALFDDKGELLPTLGAFRDFQN